MTAPAVGSFLRTRRAALRRAAVGFRRMAGDVHAALSAALDRLARCERCGGPGGWHLTDDDHEARRLCAACAHWHGHGLTTTEGGA